MTSLILNDETSKTPIGELLAAATGSTIEIKDASGRLLATLDMKNWPQDASDEQLMAWAKAEIAELRRRGSADRKRDVTTAELLARAEKLAPSR